MLTDLVTQTQVSCEGSSRLIPCIATGLKISPGAKHVYHVDHAVSIAVGVSPVAPYRQFWLKLHWCCSECFFAMRAGKSETGAKNPTFGICVSYSRCGIRYRHTLAAWLIYLAWASMNGKEEQMWGWAYRDNNRKTHLYLEKWKVISDSRIGEKISVFCYSMESGKQRFYSFFSITKSLWKHS